MTETSAFPPPSEDLEKAGGPLHATRPGESPPHLDFIDAMRGLAALMVVVAHWSVRLGSLEGAVAPFTWSLHYSVQLFFIVSAFTLMHSWETRRRADDAYGPFMRRRLFRIAPLFYVGILVFALVSWLRDGKPRGLDGIAVTATFLNGLSPRWNNVIVPGDWSISVEFLFYAVFPLLAVRIRRVSTALAFVGASLVVGAALLTPIKRWVGNAAAEPDFAYLFLTSQLWVFGLGILCYWLLRPEFGLRRRLGRLTSVPYLDGLVLVGVLLSAPLTMNLPLRFLPYPILLTALVLAAALAERPALSNRLLMAVGRVSFSVYVWHVLVIDVVDGACRAAGLGAGALRAAVLLGATLPLSVLLASVSYRLIEAPGMALGRRLFRRRAA